MTVASATKFFIHPQHWEPARGSQDLLKPLQNDKNFCQPNFLREKFGRVFLDVFSQPKFESEVRLPKYLFLPKILNLLYLFVATVHNHLAT